MDATQDLSRAYAIMDFTPGGALLPARWQAEGAAFRAALGSRAQTGLRYGPGARQTFDLFLPEGSPRGLAVFIHGGYWMSRDPSDWSAYAAGALARGWAMAMPGYTLAPEARIGAMVREVETAIAAAADRIAGPVVVSGHSAGGHLCARMACADITAPWTARLARVVPISPLADLRPLMRTAMNQTLHIDDAEALAESPALLARRDGTDTQVWVGGQERPALIWQARVLSEEWNCPWHVAPGKHHFDVLELLEHTDGALTEALVGGL